MGVTLQKTYVMLLFSSCFQGFEMYIEMVTLMKLKIYEKTGILRTTDRSLCFHFSASLLLSLTTETSHFLDFSDLKIVFVVVLCSVYGNYAHLNTLCDLR